MMQPTRHQGLNSLAKCGVSSIREVPSYKRYLLTADIYDHPLLAHLDFSGVATGGQRVALQMAQNTCVTRTGI